MLRRSMLAAENPIQYLLSLPPRMAERFQSLEGRPRPTWFAGSDPVGQPLGSGGGTVHLLAEAWRATGASLSFQQWLRSSRKLILHAGGQSRRLPAYAATGKLLMPVPVLRWAYGQRLDQSLLDLQMPDYEHVLQHAKPNVVAMIASGDVRLTFGPLPVFPEVDVLGLGMWATPETAKDFGVFFLPRATPSHLAFFLQKPSVTKIRELADQYLSLVDIGVWLLSEKAVAVLMKRCGWTPEAAPTKVPDRYEFYAQFALALGRTPAAPDPDIAALSCAVVPLPEAKFFHFGTSRQMIESISALQNLVLDESRIGLIGAREQPDQVTQNSRMQAPLRREENEAIWIENSVISPGWQFTSRHVLTGVPENQWALALPPEVCLDFVPIGRSDFCIRFYGFDDCFSGNLGDPGTRWLGQPAAAWFAGRGIDLAEAGLDSSTDIQRCPLFPVLPKDALRAEFIQWLVDKSPAIQPAACQQWQSTARLSAQQIGDQINLERLYAQRSRLRQSCLVPMMENFRGSVFFRLDLEATAREFAGSQQALPKLTFTDHEEPMQIVHDQIFRSAVLRHRRAAQWEDFESRAFSLMREMIAREAQLTPTLPKRNVLDDQIVWCRSPVRLDLAGGWTDTPPYCIEHGGAVLNVAVDLNGQPPIQVFAKLADAPELVMRSIDLGVEERVRTYAELETFAQPNSAFALAKAAFALAGFLPRFHANGAFASLEEQLRQFGGGIEISLLSAVPKGSGLGTSSILAATVLAALGDLCGLGWDRHVLFSRTLALEQMLTTGGGWQDQAGAIYGGIKLIETAPGLVQKPTLRWLPTQLFDREYANRSILLYYTGITRLAKSILQEIVRGIFLNSPSHLDVIADIGANAEFAGAAIQKCDYSMLLEAIRKSWALNQKLDAGTNPSGVQHIFDQLSDYLAAGKLLGAGGGGYLLLFAKDEKAGASIKRILQQSPPNSRARFVDFSLSPSGLQLTRS